MDGLTDSEIEVCYLRGMAQRMSLRLRDGSLGSGLRCVRLWVSDWWLSLWKGCGLAYVLVKRGGEE